MSQTIGDRRRHLAHPCRVDSHFAEIVKERAVLVVIGDQPQLSPRAIVCKASGQSVVGHLLFPLLTFVVGSYKAEDVFIPQHNGLVDLHFSEPRTFVARWKNFDGHGLSSPAALPYLAEPSFANAFYQLYLSCLYFFGLEVVDLKDSCVNK